MLACMRCCTTTLRASGKVGPLSAHLCWNFTGWPVHRQPFEPSINHVRCCHRGSWQSSPQSTVQPIPYIVKLQSCPPTHPLTPFLSLSLPIVIAACPPETLRQCVGTVQYSIHIRPGTYRRPLPAVRKLYVSLQSSCQPLKGSW